MHFSPDQAGADPHYSFICLLSPVKKHLLDCVPSPRSVPGVGKERPEIRILDIRVFHPHDLATNVRKYDHQHLVYQQGRHGQCVKELAKGVSGGLIEVETSRCRLRAGRKGGQINGFREILVVGEKNSRFVFIGHGFVSSTQTLRLFLRTRRLWLLPSGPIE